MKKVKFITHITLFIFNLSCVQNLKGCPKDTVDSRVDSMFSANFKQMGKVLKNKEAQGDDNIDRKFVYLLTFMTGVDCQTTNYTGFCFFSDSELTQWLNWYNRNKYKIKWEDIRKAIVIIGKKTVMTEEDQKFLIGLKI